MLSASAAPLDMSTIFSNPSPSSKPFIFHTVNSSRKGYVSGTTTVRQLKAAAAEYVKQDTEDRNFAEFNNARVFVSGERSPNLRVIRLNTP